MIKLDYEYDRLSKLFPFLLVCLVVLIAYLPSFTGEFILDDNPIIVNNSFYKDWHSIGTYMFQEDGYDDDSGTHTGYYRPLLGLSYTLDYKIWGLLGPGYRITNLILHLLTCCALLPLFNLLIRKKAISILLVIVFSLHPVNTETVSWAAARNNILVTLFGILALYFYIRSYSDENYYAYIASIIFFTLSIFSKELGVMLMPIFFLYHRLLHNVKKSLLTEIREYSPFIFITIIYFLLRQNTTGSLITPLEFSDTFTRIVNTPYVLLLNLRMVFIPYQLHSFIVEYPETALNFLTLSSILFLCLIGFFIWKFRRNRVLWFSATSFLCAIFPVSGLISFPAPSLISMRWLYFPLPFILLLFSSPLENLYKKNRSITLIVFTCICMYLGIYSFTLNSFLWHSSDIFFKQEVQHFKNMYYADGYAIINHKEKNYKQAKEYFEKNINSNVHRGINYLLYAELLLKEGKADNSLAFLDKAESYCKSDDELGMLFYIRGLNYLNLDNLDSAERNFKKAVMFSSENSLYWENLGVAQGKMGNHEGAILSFKNATKLGTGSSNLYGNLVYAYISNKECKKALILIKGLLKGYENKNHHRLLEDAERCLDKKSQKND